MAARWLRNRFSRVAATSALMANFFLPRVLIDAAPAKWRDAAAPLEVEAASSAPGMKHVSFAQYAANAPIEDRMVVARRDSRVYAAVFDGHGGWQVSDFASRRIVDAAEHKFEAEGKASRGASATMSSGVDASHATVGGGTGASSKVLSQVFEELDDEYADIVLPAFRQGFSGVNRVGSCAIAAIVEDDAKALTIANAGDCRAVLGRKDAASGKVRAIALTRDHNARESEEQERLAKEHPGEPDIVRCRPNNPDACYVKGFLQPTRALGDLSMKRAEFNDTGIDGMRGQPTKHNGRFFRGKSYTPPYISATPTITEVKLAGSRSGEDGKEHDEFLILATDGLWDELSSDEAVQFVANDQGPPDSCAGRLVTHALAVAAQSQRMTLSSLQQVPPGPRGRRRLHDDITAVVLWFQ